MSDQQQQFSADDLKDAILAGLPPGATGMVESAPGKYAAGLDLAKLKAITAKVDTFVQQAAPLIVGITPANFKVIVTLAISLLHASVSDPAPAESGVHVIANN